jgi:hypothetical protein
VLFSGNAASGEIIPNLRLTGPLARPVPVGQLTLKDARAFLPFTTMTIPEGHLEFVEESPWIPRLNIHGTARALDYDVQAFAFGPLDERRLILRSEPSLPQEALIQLLTTGMTPGVYAQTSLGLPPAAGGPAAEASEGKKVPQRGNEGEPAPGAPPLSVSPSYPAGRATLHNRFELWRGLSLIDETDDLAPPNGRATFRLRLR